MSNKSIETVIRENENWFRLATFLHAPLKGSLLSILHNDDKDGSYNGLPRNPAALYNELNTTFKNKINQLARTKILNQSQLDLIFPPNSTNTDSEAFDITLIVVLIINCTDLPPPLNGWRVKVPPPHDVGKAANVLRARNWRNFLYHEDPGKIDNNVFLQKKNEGIVIIGYLNFNYDTKALFASSLDPKQSTVLQALQTYLANHNNVIAHISHQEKINDYVIRRLTNQAIVNNYVVRRLTNQEDFNKTVKGRLTNQVDFNNTIKGRLSNQEDFNKTVKGRLTNQVDFNKNVNRRLTNQDQRLTNQEGTNDYVNRRLTNQNQRLVNQDNFNNNIKGRLTNQDQRTTNQDQRITNQDQRITNQYQRLTNQENDSEKEHKKLTERIYMLHKEVRAMNEQETQRLLLQTDEPRDQLLPEVVKIICKRIGNEWGELAKDLGCSFQEQQEIDKKAMEIILYKLPLRWKFIKSRLTDINRLDIVKEIQKTSLITKGLKDASLKLRAVYLNELVNCLVKQPFNEETVFEYVPREESYVDLVILEASEVDMLWNYPERDQHLSQTHMKKTNIKMNELILNDDKFVISRGIAGIGKSTMIDSFVLKWAKSEVLSGENDEADIKFLFKFTCRELNASLSSNVDSVEKLLLKSFPNVFTGLSVRDLEEIAEQVLIVIDGIDEFKDVDKIANRDPTKKNDQNVQLLKSLMNGKERNFLYGHRTLVLGRPEACQLITPLASKNNLKRVEICGFSRENVEKYVSNFFKDNLRSERVVLKICESDNLTAMSTIPVYLWVICNLFKEDMLETPVETTTELCLYACILFIRNHLKALNFQSSSLEDLIQNENFIMILIALSHMSMSTLKQRKVVFSANEIKKYKMPIKIEETGFIVKQFYGDFTGTRYQFKHLVLQEFLAAVFLFISNQHLQVDRQPNDKIAFQNCIPMVAGIFGIMQQKDNFFCPMFTALKSTFFRQIRFPKKITYWYFGRHQMKHYLETQLVRKLRSHQIVLDAECGNLLSSLYEFQGNFSKKTIRAFKESKVHIKNINFHHDVRNALHTLSKFQAYTIASIDITNTSNNQLPSNLLSFLKLYLAGKERKRLTIKGHKSNMTLKTQGSEIIIKLDTNCGFNIHPDFILGLMAEVDTVNISVDVSNLYPILKGLEWIIGVSDRLIDDGTILTPDQTKQIINAVKSRPDIFQKKHLRLRGKNGNFKYAQLKQFLPCFSSYESVDLRGGYLQMRSLNCLIRYIILHPDYPGMNLRHLSLGCYFDLADTPTFGRCSVIIKNRDSTTKQAVSVLKQMLEPNWDDKEIYIKLVSREGYNLFCKRFIQYPRNMLIIAVEPCDAYEALCRCIEIIKDKAYVPHSLDLVGFPQTEHLLNCRNYFQQIVN